MLGTTGCLIIDGDAPQSTTAIGLHRVLSRLSALVRSNFRCLDVSIGHGVSGARGPSNLARGKLSCGGEQPLFACMQTALSDAEYNQTQFL